MDVRFYETEAGSSPVLDHLRSLPRDQRQIVGAAIRRMQNARTLAEAHVDVKAFRGKLWQLRASYQRVMYFVAKGGTYWLLHAFQKETERTEKYQVEIAEKRMRDVLARR